MTAQGTYLSIIGGLFLMLVVGFGVHSCQVNELRAANRQAGLDRQNAIAERDSTRAVNARAQKVLGDSLRAVEKLAIQANIKADAFDIALNRVTQAQVSMAAAIKTLAARDVRSETPTTEDAAGVRSAHFDIRQEPFTVAADVDLPKPPAPGIMRRLDVAVDTANINVRNQCGERDAAGIRPATVTITGPPWLNFRIGKVQADDEMCNPLSPSSRWKIRHGFFLGVGYGAYADTNTVRHGWIGAAGYGFNWSPFSR